MTTPRLARLVSFTAVLVAALNISLILLFFRDDAELMRIANFLVRCSAFLVITWAAFIVFKLRFVLAHKGQACLWRRTVTGAMVLWCMVKAGMVLFGFQVNSYELGMTALGVGLFALLGDWLLMQYAPEEVAKLRELKNWTQTEEEQEARTESRMLRDMQRASEV